MIFTFYSYKGGVGRSMALANIAELLYRQGKRVVIVDWDLEAPGIEGFFYDEPKQRERINAQPGLIDLLQSYKNLYPTLSIPKPNSPEVIDRSSNIINETIYHLLKIDLGPSQNIDSEQIIATLEESNNYLISLKHVEAIRIELNKYFSKVTFESSIIYDSLKAMLNNSTPIESGADIEKLSENLPPIAPILHCIRKDSETDDTAGLWLLSAGRRNAENFSAYVKSVQDFDWTEFYNAYNGETYFNWLRKELNDFAEVILIDTRTGVSEMGGVCTRQLSDKVILFTPPNPQNISGIVEMAKSIKRPEIEAARGRKLDLIVIPCRLDNSELRDLNNFNSEFLGQIGGVSGEDQAAQFWQLGIPYVPYYTYHEELVAGASMLTSADLKDSKKSVHLETTYLKIASFMLNANFEAMPEKETINPFVGLKPFSEIDFPFFYGRSLEINRVISGITQQKMIIISGPSGAGKTSLLQAGVIPLLNKNTQPEKTSVISVSSNKNIFYNIGLALINELNKNNENLDLETKSVELTAAKMLNSEIKGGESIASIEKEHLRFRDVLDSFFFSTELSFLLIIDNAEDLFLSNSEETNKDIISKLIEWQKAKKLNVILTVRSEYLQQLKAIFSSVDLPEVETINLGFLNKSELRMIMAEPANKAGLIFEEGLVERIEKDSQELTLKLPTIQSVLYQLWQKKEGNKLTHKAYDQIGQIQGVLLEMIKKSVSHLSSVDVELARSLITRLVNIETRSRSKINLKDLSQKDIVNLKPFIDSSIVTIISDNGNEIIQLSNDLLIKNWPMLNDWLNKDQEFLIWRQQLSYSIADWEKKVRDDHYLLRGVLLDRATEWLNKRRNELSEKEYYYINNSRKKQRKSIQIISGIIILFVLIIIAFISQDIYEKHRVVKLFNSEFKDISNKSGKEKIDAICKLANFNNIYNNDSIRIKKDTLLTQCTLYQITYRQNESMINNNEAKIGQLAKILTKGSKDSATLKKVRKIDNIELELNRIAMKIKSSNNTLQIAQLKEDSTKTASSITDILATDPSLSKASAASGKIEEAVKSQNEILSAKNDNALFQQSSWFKKNYYLQFEDIKVILLNIGGDKNSIEIKLCNLVGPANCKDPIIPNPTVTLNNPLKFSYGSFNYILSLDRIGAAGLNPFTPAAYITFTKMARN